MAEVMEAGDGNVAALGGKAGQKTMFSSDERRKAFCSLLRDCEAYCSPEKSVSPASSSESEESSFAAESVSDLKEIVFETDDTAHSNGKFSREIRPPAGILCRSEMEFSKEEEEIWTVEKSPSSSSASSLLEAGGGVRTPSAAEIEELFSASEKYQQKFFREKYNYDVEKDLPLEGRYEWVPFKEEAAAPPPRCSAIEVVKGREDERA
ncbi:unnamed protein product [Cuscuta campestris]|uniref:Cyclin-dependent kinase inhibitor domain-containing protein n=1 Tax=Cuscuta campestris TaxID=132261 RepID=A0A484LQ15_9ASTE|nr:unnamed protein product [Cuscuta campestris]